MYIWSSAYVVSSSVEDIITVLYYVTHTVCPAKHINTGDVDYFQIMLCTCVHICMYVALYVNAGKLCNYLAICRYNDDVVTIQYHVRVYVCPQHTGPYKIARNT